MTLRRRLRREGRVMPRDWRASSFAGDEANRVEFYRYGDGVVGLRNPVNSHGFAMLCSPEAWEAFTAGVKAGEFDRRPAPVPDDADRCASCGHFEGCDCPEFCTPRGDDQ